jgi:inner membrane protein
MSLVTVLFLVLAGVCILSEFAATSLIGVFFGASALLVAALRGIGLVESAPVSFVLWTLFSIAMVVPLRPVLKRFVSVGSAVKDTSDPDSPQETIGQRVEVVEPINATTDDGRIRFQGTTWSARMTTGTAATGTEVQLVFRKDGVWIVEPAVPVDQGDEDNRKEAQAEVEAVVARR